MLHLYAAERIEPLSRELAAVLAQPPPDPFTPDWLAAPSQGMRRWLALDLARHLGAGGALDGVTANIVPGSPGDLRTRVLAAGRGPGDPDPWEADRLAWAVLAVTDDHADDPALATVTALPEGGSRYARARRLADDFDRYHVHRPEMVLGWAQGRDLDGTGHPLAANQSWQPHLWRLVRRRVGAPSPPERMPGLLAALGDGSIQVDLPARLCVFGLTLLPGGAGFLPLIQALAVDRDLHVFFLEPSRTLWDDAVASTAGRPGGPRPGGPSPRADDQTARAARHPLLRSWGRLTRETAVLAAGSAAPRPRWVGLDGDDGRSGAGDGPATLLGRLQSDLRANRAPSGDLDYDPDDRSVRIHGCHGAVRQVEVLRDAILGQLADPALRLREDDVLVVCPALSRFAPLVEAVFGPSAGTDGAPPGQDGAPDRPPALRYRVADRSILSTNPVLAATDALLGLLGGRFEAPVLLDFCALGPVRLRYGFTDRQIDTLTRWVDDAAVRWGFDQDHRARLGVPATIGANTWQAALDRLLLGTAVTETGCDLAVGDVAPLGVGSDEAAVAGRLADLVRTLGALEVRTSRDRTLVEWADLLVGAVTALMAAERGAEWQLDAVGSLLADVVARATSDGVPSDRRLTLTDVRRLLGEELAGEPGRSDFFRGGITVTSMVPLRWVPYRVICLLGLDQGAFGAPAVDGDDLAVAAPCLGDRDPRGEARQRLLELVLSAGERLVILRDGHDVLTNKPVPAAVPLAELSDALAQTVMPATRAALTGSLEVTHPRQGFDERYLVAGAMGVPGPWSFDPGNLAAAAARRTRGGLAPPFLARPLPPVAAPVVELADLAGFLANPVKDFFERRLGVRLPRPGEDPSAVLPVTLGGLELSAVGRRLLEARQEGRTTADWARLERRRGSLPPGSLAQEVIDTLTDEVDAMLARAAVAGLRTGPPTPAAVDVALDDGTRVVGTVPLALDGQPGAGRLTFTRPRPHQTVVAWLDLMALVAQDPDTPWRSVCVSREASKKGSGLIDLRPATAGAAGRAAAVHALEVAVDCYTRGRSEPLPLFPKLSAKLHQNKATSNDWHGFAFPGDGEDPACLEAFGDCELAELLELPARPDDPPGRGGRVQRYADYLHGTIDDSVTDGTVPVP